MVFDYFTELTYSWLQVPTGSGDERVKAQAAIQELLAGNEELAAAGKPLQLLYRRLYLPQEGMFRVLPADMKLGCYQHEALDCDGVVQEPAHSKFMFEGQQYCVGDFVYLHPRCVFLLVAL